MLTTIILLFFLFLTLVILFVIFSELVAFIRTRVPFVPTHAGDIEFIVKKLGISSRDVFYDLGSGNGKVVFLVNKLSGAKCVGFELSWWTVLFAKIKNLFYNPSQPPLWRRGGATAATPSFSKEGVGGVKFRNQNFFKANWSEANYIYAYLFPPLMGRVEQKFLADCRLGSIAIIRDFPLPNLPYAEKYYLPKKHEIYIYKKV
jgi:Histone methylation protein DOT1